MDDRILTAALRKLEWNADPRHDERVHLSNSQTKAVLRHIRDLKRIIFVQSFLLGFAVGFAIVMWVL